MTLNHLNQLRQHFNLGAPKKEPERVYGGLLHIMWRLDTDKGSYAIKQLSKDINLEDSAVIKNYEFSEQIASRFKDLGIPAVSAIDKTGRYLLIIDGTGFLIYPWVDAIALDKDEISENQALEISRILAKMHHIDLSFEEIDEPEFNIHDDKYITNLAKQSKQNQISFAEGLEINLSTLLEINNRYLRSVEFLKIRAVISHGDLDQKNVLWNKNNHPLLIDWESARKLNPTYEIVNAALDWSGITTDLNKDLFRQMLRTYQQAGGSIDNSVVEAAFYGVMGNWINWMVYNIKRAICSQDEEQKQTGIEQVNQVLSTILRVKKLMPELMNVGNL